MAYGDKGLPSLWGRRFGLQAASSAAFNLQRGLKEEPDMLVGAEAVRQRVSTDGSTSVPLRSYGINKVFGTSAASTPVYTLDTPIPGVPVTIQFASTDSAIYVNTGAGVQISGSSLGSSATTLRSSGGGAMQLVGISSAEYLALGVSSTAVNGVALQATT